MNIKTFSIQNYRSISQTDKLSLKDMTVLIGPNNEGKSNILRAVVLGLELLSTEYGRAWRGKIYNRIESYDWDRDFPLNKRKKGERGRTIIDFNFELTESEKLSFYKVTKSSLTGDLPVRLSLGKKDIQFEFRKKGRHSKSISKKRAEIATFLRENISFEYIPSVRTAQSAMAVVDELLSKELRIIESDPAYVKALETIENIQKPILAKVSSNVKKTLSLFLKNVKKVHLQVNRENRYRALRQHCEIIIDDGSETDLRLKGDGIQSLAGIALIKHASENTAKGKHLVLAIEEPESHLHPDAIHELRKVLLTMSTQNQVIITTHNPVLVNKKNIDGNIIVETNKARAANKLNDIREILGVRLSDNLQSAEFILVLEGEEDIKPMRTLLSHFSPVLKLNLESGRLIIDSMGGASNVTQKSAFLRTTLSEFHFYMDNDRAGIEGAKKAIESGIINSAQVTYTICNGLKSSEIEDLYSSSIYEEYFKNEYNIIISEKTLGDKGVWSDRVKKLFAKEGQIWSDNIEYKIKHDVSLLISANPNTALLPYRKDSFDKLIKTLEGYFTK